MSMIQTSTGADPTPEDPTYIQAMIDKANGVTPQTPPVSPPSQEEPPKLFADKYKSVEDLEKGYRELQKAFSSKATVVPPVTNPPPSADPPTNPLTIPAPDPNAPPSADLDDPLANTGLDISVFNTEWQEKGALSVESYEKLAKAGIPQQMVDAYIEGQQVIAERLTTRVFDTAGGQEEYKSLMAWASTGVSAEEIATYNSLIEARDINQILLATKGLKATMEESRGKAPQLLNADGSGSPGNTDSFTSKSQLTAAMSDPRYAKDPSYREAVINKLSRSNIF